MQRPSAVPAALVAQQWVSHKQQLLSHSVQLTILGSPLCLVLILVQRRHQHYRKDAQSFLDHLLELSVHFPSRTAVIQLGVFFYYRKLD